ncbi:MAG: lytic transglycosylase domain-containing protein, partial [Acetobacter persici]
RDTPHPDPVPEAPDPAPVAVAQAETPPPAPPAPVQSAPLSSDIQPATRGRNASPSFTQSSSLPPARVQNAVYTTTASSSDHMLRLPASYSPAAGASHLPVLSSAVVTRPLQTPSRNGKGGTVQVGAFASYAEARHAAERVNRVLASRSMQATPTVQPVSVSGKAMYRAQLIASGGAQASGVCQILHARSMPCFPVRNS